MTSLKLLLVISLITACHSKPAPAPEQKLDESLIANRVEKPPEFSKMLRESIYFANSLEREALKLLTKDSSFQRLTLFSVLSYVVEISSGAKKSTPLGLDCGKFTVKKLGPDISILKSCSKPFSEMAHIRIIQEKAQEAEYAVDFTINEWSGVLGMAVTLTGSNVRCLLNVKSARLSRMNCDNWSYLISESHLSATVIKAKEFRFERDAQKQFVIKGGYFKELIENKKIDITVPLEGKIKIIEKEIRVIDEFLDKKSEEKVEKENPAITKEEYDKVIKEKEQSPKTEEISEDGSQGEVQTQSEAENGEVPVGDESSDQTKAPSTRSRGGR